MKLREAALWINLFIFVLSLLLCVFFFQKIWGFDRQLVNEFKEGKCDITSINIVNKTCFWPCNSENDNLWWYTYFKDNFMDVIVMKGNDPKPNIDPETKVNFRKCYHGIISVRFNFSDPLNNDQLTLANSNISGLYSSNSSWISGYLEPFRNKSSIACYYKPLNPYQVLPFLPNISNIGLICGFVFLVATCLSFIAIVVLFFQRYRYRKEKYQIFIKNNNNNSSNSKKSIGLGGSMTGLNSGKISTAGIVSSSSIGVGTPTSQKNKLNILESTLEFNDFSFNLQQATNQNQKPIKSALKQPLSNDSSPSTSSSSSSKNKRHLVIDEDASDSLEQLLVPLTPSPPNTRSNSNNN